MLIKTLKKFKAVIDKLGEMKGNEKFVFTLPKISQQNQPQSDSLSYELKIRLDVDKNQPPQSNVSNTGQQDSKRYITFDITTLFKKNCLVLIFYEN